MTAPPDRLTVPPNRPGAHAADPLSDLLRSVRLTGGVFLDAQFTAPWCVSSQITAEDCRPLMAVPAQIIAYHFVVAGRLLLSIDGEPAVEVRAGEIVLLPRNDRHRMASALGLQPVNAHELIEASADGGLARIVHGGGGEPTHIACGYLGSDDAGHPLLASLPGMLKLDLRQGTSHDWVEASVRFAAGELASGRMATSSVMSRLSELLLIEAIRQYVTSAGAAEIGWLRGLNDPYVGRALALMHRNISAPWSADALAKEVALSRSAFTDRFRTLVGMPPIRYLTSWRLRTAKLLLGESAKTIGQLAHAVGYESEEAFSRAFKRAFGVSPVRWRDRRPGD